MDFLFGDRFGNMSKSDIFEGTSYLLTSNLEYYETPTNDRIRVQA